MSIIFFAHPDFLGSQSMPRFVSMLADGMRRRNWKVTIMKPKAKLSALPLPALLKKWLGYIDQYVIFPGDIRRTLKASSQDTLYVFTDHALGPWVPPVAHRPHVIHCHDFLAQKSAIGVIAENRTAWLGKIYQRYIRKGYSTGKNFISVSRQTQTDLLTFLETEPLRSEVLYNGLNRIFNDCDPISARFILSEKIRRSLAGGYLLHVGGNQWYKNRNGVILMYDAWRAHSEKMLPLIMVGKPPDKKLLHTFEQSAFKKDIHWVEGLSDELLPVAYAGATALLFPSLAEGFGWPIAEAMACGCPVITTDAAPMSEVAGNAAYLLPVMPENPTERTSWLLQATILLDQIVTMSEADRQHRKMVGMENVQRFNTEKYLDAVNEIYTDVLRGHLRRQTDSRNFIGQKVRSLAQ